MPERGTHQLDSAVLPDHIRLTALQQPQEVLLHAILLAYLHMPQHSVPACPGMPRLYTVLTFRGTTCHFLARSCTRTSE